METFLAGFILLNVGSFFQDYYLALFLPLFNIDVSRAFSTTLYLKRIYYSRYKILLQRFSPKKMLKYIH